MFSYLLTRLASLVEYLPKKEVLPGHVKIFSLPDIGEANEMLHHMSPIFSLRIVQADDTSYTWAAELLALPDSSGTNLIHDNITSGCKPPVNYIK